MEREEEKGRKRGLTFAGGTKKNRRIDGRDAGCLRRREGEKVKGMRDHRSTNYNSASR